MVLDAVVGCLFDAKCVFSDWEIVPVGGLVGFDKGSQTSWGGQGNARSKQNWRIKGVVVFNKIGSGVRSSVLQVGDNIGGDVRCVNVGVCLGSGSRVGRARN